MFGHTTVFDEYLEAFCKLADSEGLEYNRKKLAKTLSRYPLSDIERVYDACLRFSLTNMLKAV